MLSTTKCNHGDGFILGANIWLQLGWASPCEVTKNLARLSSLYDKIKKKSEKKFAGTIGHGVIQVTETKKT
jgi:hypothetical protein